jgi:RND family efflux transporter MFP subunit
MTPRVGVTSAGVAAMMAAAAFVWPARPVPSGPTAIVREAPFRVTLVERGTIDAARLMLYGSTIAGTQAKILEIVPEGTAVAPGDVLVRFDPAPFEAAVERETAAVAQADADRQRSLEDLRLEGMRAQTEVDAAGQQLGFAQTELASERDGKGPLAIAEAEAAAKDAARELAQARASVDDMHALSAQGFVTRAEVDRAQHSLEQAEDRQRIADLKLKTLLTFAEPAAIDKSRADVASAEKALSGATEAGRSHLTQRRAALVFAESRLDEARGRLAHARDQVSRTTIRAATAGLVVYRELFFGTDKRKPQAGDEVWPNQPLVAVPDPAQLVVQTRVRETDLHKLSSSQRVTVSVDAYPGLALPAHVSLIGALAQEDAARAGTRFFPITVTLSSPDDRLRTGMSARVEIEVASLDRAVVVPLQALMDEGGVIRCSVITRTGSERRVVDVAARNDVVAAIRSGLRPGETVLLVDPANPAADRHDRP